jgi:hypothetical protein
MNIHAIESEPYPNSAQIPIDSWSIMTYRHIDSASTCRHEHHDHVASRKWLGCQLYSETLCPALFLARESSLAQFGREALVPSLALSPALLRWVWPALLLALLPVSSPMLSLARFRREALALSLALLLRRVCPALFLVRVSSLYRKYNGLILLSALPSKYKWYGTCISYNSTVQYSRYDGTVCMLLYATMLCVNVQV